MSPKRYDIRPKLLLMTNRKLHMRFRLASRSMTLDDLELEKENNIFSSFRRQYLANSTHRCRALTFASARLSLSCIFKKQVYYLGSWRCILTPTGWRSMSKPCRTLYSVCVLMTRRIRWVFRHWEVAIEWSIAVLLQCTPATYIHASRSCLQSHIGLTLYVTLSITWDMSLRKSCLWLGQNTGPIFRRLWTKAHQIWWTCTGVIIVCNANRRYLVSIQRHSRSSCEIAAKLWCFSAAKFFLGAEVLPIFLTHVCKSGSQSNRWQSVVTFGLEIFEITRRKRKKPEKETSPAL